MLELARLSMQLRRRECLIYNGTTGQIAGLARDERSWWRRLVSRLAVPRQQQVLTVREQLDHSLLATLHLRRLGRQVQAVLVDALDAVVGSFAWRTEQEFWVYDSNHRPALLVLPPNPDGLRHIADWHGRPASTLHEPAASKATTAQPAPLLLVFHSSIAEQPLARMLVLAVGLARLTASWPAPSERRRHTARPTR
jgi:hypothetical protein